MARGLICYADGRHDRWPQRATTSLLAPPFIVTDADLEEIVDRLAARSTRRSRPDQAAA